MLALACMDPEKQTLIRVDEIVKRTEIPEPFLRKILHALGKSRVIETKRVYKGGVLLSRPARQISLLDVAEAVQGNDWINRCLLGLARYGNQQSCTVHDFWLVEKMRIQELLRKVTIDQVAEYELKPGGRLKRVDANCTGTNKLASQQGP